MQADVKVKEVHHVACNLANTKCLWSSSPTANHVVTMCEGILVEAWKMRNSFNVRRNSFNDNTVSWDAVMKEELRRSKFEEHHGNAGTDHTDFCKFIPVFLQV